MHSRILFLNELTGKGKKKKLNELQLLLTNKSNINK